MAVHPSLKNRNYFERKQVAQTITDDAIAAICQVTWLADMQWDDEIAMLKDAEFKIASRRTLIEQLKSSAPK